MKNLALRIKAKKEEMVLSDFGNRFGDCTIERGRKTEQSKKEFIYLVVFPSSKDDIKEFYLLDEEFSVKRKICGCIRGSEYQKLNYRCLNHAGMGTDHKGFGYCKCHRRQEKFENKFRRKYLLKYLNTEKDDVFISSLEALESYPVDTISDMEGLINLTRSLFSEKINRRRKMGAIGVFDKDVDNIIQGYIREMRNQLRDLHFMKRESSYSPLEIERWLNEVRRVLEKKKGVEIAREVVYLLLTTNGFLNKTESEEEFSGRLGKIGIDRVVEKIFPLGYSHNGDDMEDVDYVDVE